MCEMAYDMGICKTMARFSAASSSTDSLLGGTLYSIDFRGFYTPPIAIF